MSCLGNYNLVAILAASIFMLMLEQALRTSIMDHQLHAVGCLPFMWHGRPSCSGDSLANSHSLIGDHELVRYNPFSTCNRQACPDPVQAHRPVGILYKLIGPQGQSTSTCPVYAYVHVRCHSQRVRLSIPGFRFHTELQLP